MHTVTSESLPGYRLSAQGHSQLAITPGAAQYNEAKKQCQVLSGNELPQAVNGAFYFIGKARQLFVIGSVRRLSRCLQ